MDQWLISVFTRHLRWSVNVFGTIIFSFAQSFALFWIMMMPCDNSSSITFKKLSQRNVKILIIFVELKGGNRVKTFVQLLFKILNEVSQIDLCSLWILMMRKPRIEPHHTSLRTFLSIKVNPQTLSQTLMKFKLSSKFWSRVFCLKSFWEIRNLMMNIKRDLF